MLLHLHCPAAPLDRFVEMATYFEGYSPQHTKEKLLPDGAVEIIVDLTGSPKRLFDRRLWSYLLVNGGYLTVSFAVMGSILGAWR